MLGGKGIQNNISKTSSLIQQLSDDEVINHFNNSSSVKEFGRKIGYKDLSSSNSAVNSRLKAIGLNINDIKQKGLQNCITKGELFNTSISWQHARNYICKDARKIFQSSCKDKSCVVCGYNNHVEVAHIKSVSSFTDNTPVSEINDISNLIALCPNHHWEYDNNILDISSYVA